MKAVIRDSASVLENIAKILPLMACPPIETWSKTNKACRKSCYKKECFLEHGQAGLFDRLRTWFDQRRDKIATDPKRDGHKGIHNQWIYPAPQSNEKADASPAQCQFTLRRVLMPPLCQAQCAIQEPQHHGKCLNVAACGTHFLDDIVEWGKCSYNRGNTHKQVCGAALHMRSLCHRCGEPPCKEDNEEREEKRFNAEYPECQASNHKY